MTEVVMIGWFVLQAAVFIFILWLGWAYYDKRYKQGNTKSGMYSGSLMKTGEVFIDPKDGVRYRVYFDPKTGERHYVKED